MDKGLATQAEDAPATFSELGVEAGIVRALKAQGVTVPTPIQRRIIPLALQNKDVRATSPTGTGKTHGYGVSLLQQLLTKKDEIALVLLPTRELTEQSKTMLQPIGHEACIRIAYVTGGMPKGKQVSILARPDTRLIVATPGRLQQMVNEESVSLKKVTKLVVDEADRMLDVNFRDDIQKLLQNIPRDRQTMMFTATMSQEVRELAATLMRDDASEVDIGLPGAVPEQIDQQLFHVRGANDKRALLENLLAQHPEQFIIFRNKKMDVTELARFLCERGHNAIAIHKGYDLEHRARAMNGFKSREYRILVGTDVIGRGIDAPGDIAVVNFDLPVNPDDYIHRIGRSGRGGRSGKAFSFAAVYEADALEAIENKLGSPIPRAPMTGEVVDGSTI